jgi:hypothetical protein
MDVISTNAPRQSSPSFGAFDLAFLDSREVRIAIFAAFAFLLILPIWLVKYPPLVDYPNHLARAFVLHHLHDPNYQFGRFYAADWGPNPYFLADFLVQIFQYFVGIYVAGKLILTLCILALPFSVVFFLRRANPGSEYLALWGFAIAYNLNFLMGFMSFELSISLCFIVVGIWLDYRRSERPMHWLVTFLLTTLLFLTHLGGFVMAGVILILHTAMTAGIGKRVFKAGTLFVPGALMFLWAKLHGWSGRGLDYKDWSVRLKLRHMLVPIQEYSRLMTCISLLAVILTIGYFLWRRWQLKVHYVWMAIAAVIVAIHWIVPDDYGDLGFIGYRFCIFAFIVALAIPVFQGSRVIPIALACSIFVLHVFQVGHYWAGEQKRLAQMANDFRYIPPNAVIFAYTSMGERARWESDDLHFWGYGVIERGWITPSLFHQTGVQPLQLRVPMYADDDQYGDGLQKHKYSPDKVEQTYDYLWTTDVDYLSPYLAQIGTPIYEQGQLEIFKSKPSIFP